MSVRVCCKLVAMLAAVGACQARGAPERPRAGVARTPSEIVRCREFAVRSSSRSSRDPPPRPAPAREPVRLRSAGTALAENGCAEAAERWNFYGAGNDGIGCFVNDLVVQKDVVLDLATGLMWRRQPYHVASFEEAEQVIAELVRRRMNGFADWRLPTVEEQLSLQHPSTVSRVDEAFSEHWDIWSADRLASSGAHLAVGEIDGQCQVPLGDPRVRAVRTLTRAEWAQAVGKR